MPQLVLERNGSGVLLRRYVNGQGRPLFMSTSATTAFYHWDPLGSVRNVSSSSGRRSSSYDGESARDQEHQDLAVHILRLYSSDE